MDEKAVVQSLIMGLIVAVLTIWLVLRIMGAV